MKYSKDNEVSYNYVNSVRKKKFGAQLLSNLFDALAKDDKQRDVHVHEDNTDAYDTYMPLSPNINPEQKHMYDEKDVSLSKKEADSIINQSEVYLINLVENRVKQLFCNFNIKRYGFYIPLNNNHTIIFDVKELHEMMERLKRLVSPQSSSRMLVGEAHLKDRYYYATMATEIFFSDLKNKHKKIKQITMSSRHIKAVLNTRKLIGAVTDPLKDLIGTFMCMKDLTLTSTETTNNKPKITSTGSKQKHNNNNSILKFIETNNMNLVPSILPNSSVSMEDGLQSIQDSLNKAFDTAAREISVCGNRYEKNASSFPYTRLQKKSPYNNHSAMQIETRDNVSNNVGTFIF
ncbi:MAG: hypothetical protein COB50_01425 [Thiotrichales bacterium]|nr:MAG: hypothetical protein COB50_01425 [Thiotrichales bacterium]